MSPAFDAAIATIVPDGQDGGARVAVRPAGRREERGDGDERHERDARRRLRGDAHDAHDARRDRDEENAEDTHAGRADGPRKLAHVAREDPGHERGREHDERDAREHETARQVAVRPRDRAGGILRRSAATASHSSHDGEERAGHRGKVLQDREDARRRDRARADVPHVARPDLPRRHRRDELDGLGRERRRQPLPDDGDERDQDEGRHDRARHQHARLPVAEDVAHGEERGSELDGELGLRQERERRADLGRHDEEEGHDDLHESAHGHAAEDPSAAARIRRRRAQHLGAGGALGVRQLVVRVDDQEAAERDHRGEAEQGSEETERDDLQVRRRRPPEEERGNREDRARRERRGGRADRLREIRLEDRAPPAEEPEDGHGQDRGGNRGRNREPDPQAEIGVRRAEDEAERDARDHGLRGELGERRLFE